MLYANWRTFLDSIELPDDDPAKGKIPLVIADDGSVLRYLQDCPEWLRKHGKQKKPAKQARKRVMTESDSIESYDRHRKGHARLDTKRARHHRDRTSSDSTDSESDDHSSTDDDRVTNVKAMRTNRHDNSHHTKSSGMKSHQSKAFHAQAKHAKPSRSKQQAMTEDMSPQKASGSRPKPRPVYQYGRVPRDHDCNRTLMYSRQYAGMDLEDEGIEIDGYPVDPADFFVPEDDI